MLLLCGRQPPRPDGGPSNRGCSKLAACGGGGCCDDDVGPLPLSMPADRSLPPPPPMWEDCWWPMAPRVWGGGGPDIRWPEDGPQEASRLQERSRRDFCSEKIQSCMSCLPSPSTVKVNMPRARCKNKKNKIQGCGADRNCKNFEKKSVLESLICAKLHTSYCQIFVLLTK